MLVVLDVKVEVEVGSRLPLVGAGRAGAASGASSRWRTAGSAKLSDVTTGLRQPPPWIRMSQ